MEKDLNKPFGVFFHDGSIGRKTGLLNLKGDKLYQSFDDKDEAKEYAKRARSRLSKGEKSYYNMKYYVMDMAKAKVQKFL